VTTPENKIKRLLKIGNSYCKECEALKLWKHKETQKIHNDFGPAVKWEDGSEEYWVQGERHREDGPAVLTPYGYEEYWLNNKKMTKAEHSLQMERQNQSLVNEKHFKTI
jgi:hypothetical protein